MELSLQSMTGEPSVDMINVSDQVFSAKFNEVLIHQVIVTYLAGARAGTRAQKTRSQVKGTGSKPWRQKGTGRARAGSVTSPLWRSGGVTFAAKPADFSKKINKKMYRIALRSILSELIRQKRLLIIEQFTVEAPKTREIVTKLNTLNINEKVLIVIKDEDESLFLAARNLPRVQVSEVKAIDPVSLVRFEKVLMTVSALKAMEEQLA